jgi:hypothetical protein
MELSVLSWVGASYPDLASNMLPHQGVHEEVSAQDDVRPYLGELTVFLAVSSGW